jgi:hypothetical protein
VGNVATIKVDIWLYGDLARFGGAASTESHANVLLTAPDGATVRDVLTKLSMPTEERGITFINGKLSAMPGLQPDLDLPLIDGDRIAFFHLKSMWPFQYRHGVSMTDEMDHTIRSRKDRGLHHSYKS